MRFSFLNTLAFTLLICLFSCNSSKKENNESNNDSTVIKDTTSNVVENTQAETTIEFSEEDSNKEGGYFNVSLGEEKLNVKTNFADNGLSMDKNTGVTTIMAGNADTSIIIALKGAISGEFPIKNDNKHSANVDINLTTTSGNINGSLTEGTVNITELDEAAGTATGDFSGKTADGKEAKGEFKLNLKKM